MSRSQRASNREQNGSLTSEPDSMSQWVSGGMRSSGGRAGPRSSAKSCKSSSSRDENGPETSTPVKSENHHLPDPSTLTRENRSSVHGHQHRDGVRRNLTDDLDMSHSSTSSTAGAVHRVNQAAAAMRSGAGSVAGVAFSPAMSSIQQDATSSAFGVSPASTKRSFTSEYESGTIAAQRHELQMLMAELQDRDRELNEMVKAHHQQLHGWEEDRQRVLTLENRNSQLKAEAQRKKEQVRALVARLKTLELGEASKRAALDQTQGQLHTVTEQLTQSQLKVTELQEKSHQMSNMVKELSNTLSKLEGKEQEMLSLLKLKDKDLTSASSHLSELSTKLKTLDTKVKAGQRAEADARRDVADWKGQYAEAKKDVDRLRADLNRSQLDEEESRLEVDRARREQERLHKQIGHMDERKKRQEEMITSQRLKQERTDAELNSIRQLYERQQQDLWLLQLNLDSTKELLNNQNKSCQADHSDVSLLLQSPTSGRPVAYYTGESTVTMKTSTSFKPDLETSADNHTVVSPPAEQGPYPAAQPVQSPTASVTPTPPVEKPDSRSVHHHQHMSAVGTGHHHQPLELLPMGTVDRAPEVGGDTDGCVVGVSSPEQQWTGRSSGIPVMIQDKGTRWAGTPRPTSVTAQYRGRSLERGERVAGVASNPQSHSSEQRVKVGCTSSESLEVEQPDPAQQRQQQHYHPPQQSEQHHPKMQQKVSSSQHEQQSQLQQSGFHQQKYQHNYQRECRDMHTVEEQLKQLQTFSRQLRVSHSLPVITHNSDPLSGIDSCLTDRPTTPPITTSSFNNSSINQEFIESGFRTPPRRTTLSSNSQQRTPSPQIAAISYQGSFLGSPVDAMTSPGVVVHDDSVSGDYPEQTGLSAGVVEEEEDSLAGRAWLLEEEGKADQEVSRWTGASGAGITLQERRDDTNASIPESPTSKLHRLLTESRQMVKSLERSTYPPFFPQEPLSPIKTDIEEE